MAYRDVILAETSLQSYWHLDEASGNSLDQKGAINGTYGAGVERVIAGLIASDAGLGAGFIAADVDNITYGDNYNFTGTESFTAEVWVKPTTLTGDAQYLVDKRATSGWVIDYFASGTRFRRWDSGGASDGVLTGAMTAGVANYIVATYDGATIKISLNAGTPVEAASTRSITATTNPLVLGNSSIYDGGTTGTIDEFAIYNAALSASAITAHYNAAIGKPGRIFKRFSGPALLTNVAANLYTVPTGRRATIRHIHVSNPTGSPVDFTLSIGTDAAGTRLWDGIPVPADNLVQEFRDHTLVAGEKIQGFAGTTNVLNLTIDGYEESI